MVTIHKAVFLTLLVGCHWDLAVGAPTIVSTSFQISGGDVSSYLTDYGPSLSNAPIQNGVTGVAPSSDPEEPPDLWSSVFAKSLAGYCVLPPASPLTAPEGMGVYAEALGTDFDSVYANAAATYMFTCNTGRVRVDLAGDLYGFGQSMVSYSLTGPGLTDSHIWSLDGSVDPLAINETLFYSIVAGGEYTLSLAANMHTFSGDSGSLCATVSCIPAPTAFLLGVIGAGCIGSMRRRVL